MTAYRIPIMLVLWVMFLVGCGGSVVVTPSPTAVPPTLAVATTAPTATPALPTPEAAFTPTLPPAPTDLPVPPTATVAPPDAIAESRTAEGYHVLGDPNAPVTLVMFSDFL
ncbi:hypothetical protein [Candidatus Chloroploca sp. Khr17]|uniref:hypothetical protein n=1 Tax=Candidatus Chloroploca sp. Khr17 TaxID=2496869 RepID=UPI00101D7365|nr:hypothetical protein [Candidatus Chloroploca sp. Khr17]